jgi:hypothetical protein
MRHTIKRLVVEITSAAILAFIAGPASASIATSSTESFRQQMTTASDKPLLLAEEGFLQKLQDAKIDKIAGEIEKDPKLIDDPDYLAKHPKLGDYIKSHPEAKQKIKDDPKGFFQHLKAERS